MQHVDLSELEDRLAPDASFGELARMLQAFGHDAVHRAADRLEADHFLLARELERRELAVVLRVAQLRFGQRPLRDRLIACLRRNVVLPMKIHSAVGFFRAEIEPRFPRAHRAFHLRALLGDRRRRALERSIEGHELLAFAHDIAAVDVDALDQALDRRAYLDHLPRLDDAIEVARVRRCCHAGGKRAE